MLLTLKASETVQMASKDGLPPWHDVHHVGGPHVNETLGKQLLKLKSQANSQAKNNRFRGPPWHTPVLKFSENCCGSGTAQPHSWNI
jgi:hypothetical protein